MRIWKFHDNRNPGKHFKVVETNDGKLRLNKDGMTSYTSWEDLDHKQYIESSISCVWERKRCNHCENEEDVPGYCTDCLKKFDLLPKRVSIIE